MAEEKSPTPESEWIEEMARREDLYGGFPGASGRLLHRTSTQRICAVGRPLFQGQLRTWCGQNITGVETKETVSDNVSYGLDPPVTSAWAKTTCVACLITRDHFDLLPDAERRLSAHMGSCQYDNKNAAKILAALSKKPVSYVFNDQWTVIEPDSVDDTVKLASHLIELEETRFSQTEREFEYKKARTKVKKDRLIRVIRQIVEASLSEQQKEGATQDAT